MVTVQMNLVNGLNNKGLKEILKKIDDYSRMGLKKLILKIMVMHQESKKMAVQIWISLQFNTTTDLEGLKSYLSNYKLKEYKQ